jgi:hypothetical protein
MRRALPGSEYYGGSAPPGPFGGRCAYPHHRAGRAARGTATGWFPCSLLFACRRRSPAMPLRHRHGYAADLPHGLPDRPVQTAGRSPPPNKRQGSTASSPHPPGSSWRHDKGALHRRFLAYSSPSRSPNPHHLAVLARPGFVRAASHPDRHHPAEAALSYSRLLRQATGGGLSPPLEQQRLTAHCQVVSAALKRQTYGRAGFALLRQRI